MTNLSPEALALRQFIQMAGGERNPKAWEALADRVRNQPPKPADVEEIRIILDRTFRAWMSDTSMVEDLSEAEARAIVARYGELPSSSET